MGHRTTGPSVEISVKHKQCTEQLQWSYNKGYGGGFLTSLHLCLHNKCVLNLCSARPLEGPGCHVHGRQVLRHLCHECWLPDYSWGIFWDKCPCFPCHWSLLLQVMPTQLRGQGTALVNGMSMVAQMASPYIVYSVRLGLAWLPFNMFYRQFYQRRLLFL